MAKLDTLRSTWKLDGDLELLDEDKGGPHRLCIECAYLPFTAELSEDDIHQLVDDEFSGIFEMDLPSEEVSALCEGEESIAVIDGPQQHHFVIIRLKYSADGGKTWSDYSNLHSLRYAPRLELTFDPNRAGYALRFEPDGRFSGRKVVCKQHDDLFHTALFGIAVTSEMTSVFRIKFKVHAVAVNKQYSDFFVGFATKSTLENYDQVRWLTLFILFLVK